jgi:hypothetical protein
MLEMAEKNWVGVMNRIGMAASLVALAGIFAVPAQVANAQSTLSGVRVAQAAPWDAPAPRRRPQTRLRVTPYYEPEGVYPHYNPGPNAVRVCNATYVQEYRPSGTVIVPRMTCYWRR